MTTEPNFASGTVWTGDNLPIMRGMNDACIGAYKESLTAGGGIPHDTGLCIAQKI